MDYIRAADKSSWWLLFGTIILGIYVVFCSNPTPAFVTFVKGLPSYCANDEHILWLDFLKKDITPDVINGDTGKPCLSMEEELRHYTNAELCITQFDIDMHEETSWAELICGPRPYRSLRNRRLNHLVGERRWVAQKLDCNNRGMEVLDLVDERTYTNEELGITQAIIDEHIATNHRYEIEWTRCGPRSLEIMRQYMLNDITDRAYWDAVERRMEAAREKRAKHL